MHEVFSSSSTAKTGLGEAMHDMRSARALVIDSNLTSRSILRTMMSDLGVPGDRIKQVGRYNDARAELERTRYDIVLCTTTSVTPARPAPTCSTNCAPATTCPSPPFS